jgi:hypothetical protein
MRGLYMRWLCICLAVPCAVACREQGPSPLIGARTTPTGPTTVPAPATAPISIEMSGTVVEIGAGPLAGATVSVRSCDDSPSLNHLFGQTQSDAAGAFRLTIDSGSQLPVGCVDLLAEKGGYESTIAEPREPGHDNIRFRMQRLRSATGRVVEVDGGRPVPGVRVFTHEPQGPPTFSDANGVFVLSGVATSLSLDKSGYVARTVGMPAGQDLNLGTIRIQRTIVVSAGSTLTGRISSEDVDYEVFAWGEDIEFCSPCKWIELQPEEQDLEIRLQWSGEIPLTIWAAAVAPYDIFKSPGTQPGESSLALRVPASTRILIVGVSSRTPGQQTPRQPISFTLSAVVR